MKAIHNGVAVTQKLWETVFNISKIQNESNSQQKEVTIFYLTTVFNISKIQNESNSQLKAHHQSHRQHCVQYFKDTK